MSNTAEQSNPTESGTGTETTTTEAGSLLEGGKTDGKADDKTAENLLGGDGDKSKSTAANDDDTGGGDKSDSGDAKFDAAELDLDGLKSALGPDIALPDEVMGEFSKIVNEAGSKQELAEGLLKLYQSTEEAAVKEIADQWDEVQTSWKSAVKADKEIGGANFDKSLATARELIETYAPDPSALKEILTQTGAGNNVEVIKFLVKLASTIPGEATPAEGTPGKSNKSLAERLFPSQS